MKWTLVSFAALAVVAVSEARSWSLRGACQDASYNLYTASYYPSSSKLRVSKRSATNTGVWVHDITPPSGFKYTGVQVLRLDSSGNLYIATALINASTTLQEFQLLKLDSSGATLTSAVYAPAAAGQNIGLSGMVLDSSGNVYLAGSYNVSGVRNCFIRKHTSTFGSPVARAVAMPAGYSTLLDDCAADSAGNVYVSAIGSKSSPVTVAATVYQWDSSFGSSPTWQQTYTLGSNGAPAATGAGCLEVDSSNNVTYIGPYSDTTLGASNIFAVQYNSSGTKNWDTQPSLAGSYSDWMTVDSSGDLVVVGSTTTTNYTIAKFNGSTGALSWSSTRAISGGSGVQPTLCQDASGDYLVVSYQTISGVMKSLVDRFTGSTGAYSTTYTYAGAGGADYGERVFPTSTAGNILVFGIGLSSGTYYPLTYRQNTGTTSWSDYQTATIP